MPAPPRRLDPSDPSSTSHPSDQLGARFFGGGGAGGGGGEGAAPRVVLVHGFTQTGRSFDRIAGALSARREVVCVDLPGHGQSSGHPVDDLAGAARLVGATGGRAAYVGYSLGGRTCLVLALEHPGLVDRLVLVAATAGIGDDDERARRRAADEVLAGELDGLGQGSIEGFLERWLAGPLFAHLTAEQADVPARRANTGPGLAASLRSCGTGAMRPVWDRLGELAMPVLVLAGERDGRYVAIAERLVAGIGGNARLGVVPDAGHAVPFEAPGPFVDAVEDFLDGPFPAG